MAAISSLPVPSLCTFTYTTTATSYTSTTSKIVYTLPTKCYDTAIIQSLQPPAVTPSISTSTNNTFVPTVYACSATTVIVSTTTVAAIATAAIGTYSWPFYVQADNSDIDNGSFARVVTYDATYGNSFMQFTAPAHGPATQYQLDDNCVLGLAWNTSHPDWVAANEGGSLIYFGTPKELGEPQDGTNTSCAVSAASVLTCRSTYGNTTYLTGNTTNTDQFNNVLNIASATTTKDIFGNPFYPVTLGLTFI
ncbi:hypothetical protein AMS68_000109 [Peltaster fructicola]|uniref:Uncharacterized protein n=1 Tax=Peltaster fructicola TaxID=286661 RepID=A0A6H0XIP8_9PEZI|nr:hypothetical protein AMS68_000109 [Peltaster fructicola]